MGYYQAMQLAQFLFSLSLVFLAFAAGMYLGWRRWGRNPRPRTEMDASDEPMRSATTSRRPDLFAPELDLEPDVVILPRGELTAGS